MQSVGFGSVLCQQNPEPGWAEEGEQVSTSRRCLCFSPGVPAASPGAGPAVALRRGEARACRDTWWLPASLRPRGAGAGDPPPGSIAPRGAGGGGGGTRRVTVSWEPWWGIAALKCCAVVWGGCRGSFYVQHPPSSCRSFFSAVRRRRGTKDFPLLWAG